MTTYFTSDTHFSHTNIIRYCNRPWRSVEDMNAGIVANINSVVGLEDTLIHVGDYAMGAKASRLDTVKQILCKNLILVRGNHDEGEDRLFLEAGFKAVLRQAVLIDPVYGSILVEHVPNLNHKNSYQFCGHVHQSWKNHANKIINVGVDVRDYKPMSIETLMADYANDVTIRPHAQETEKDPQD